jgi:hypothetical protein
MEYLSLSFMTGTVDLFFVFGNLFRSPWKLVWTLVPRIIPQTDGQTEQTIQTLEDMLQACVIDFGGSWDTHLLLIKFSYNNRYHASMQCAPFEALYCRKCRSPVCCAEIGENQISGPEMVQEMMDKIYQICERIKAA